MDIQAQALARFVALSGLFVTCSWLALTSQVAQAVTIYTTVDGIVVRNKPSTTGSSVVATLKADTMVETNKRVGDYISVSFVVGGKVKAGYIATKQLELAASDITQVGSDPLKALEFSEADLAAFAKSGKLVERKSKSSSDAKSPKSTNASGSSEKAPL